LIIANKYGQFVATWPILAVLL